MTAHKLVPLLALGLNLLLLGSALAADRRGSRNVVFAYLAACLALWNLGVFGLRWTTDPATALLWQRILHLGVIPIPVLFYHYVLVLLDLPRRRSLVGGYVLCGGFLALSATPALIGGVRDTPWGFVPAAGPLYAPFFVFLQSYLVLGLVRLVLAYRRQTSSFRRNRTALVIVGAVVSLLGGAVDFVRFILDWAWLYPIGIPTNAFFALALGVAIVRYRLMDVGTLVRRVVLYLATSAALAPVLFLGLYAVDLVLVRRPAAGGDELGLLVRDGLMLLLVFTVALPLLRRLELALERLMFRRQHGVRDLLAALGRELPSLLDPVALARTLTTRLVSDVPARHASLHLRDAATAALVPTWAAISPDVDEAGTAVAIEEPVAVWLAMTGQTLIVEETSFPGQAYERLRPPVAKLERSRTALLVPLLLDGELRAVLALGEKLSGEIYSGGEIEVLETLMGETAVALKNARLYQDVREQMEEVRRTQEQLFQTAKLAAVGEMAAGIAHELNSPLMVILGHSGLLERELPAGSRAAEQAATIAGEATRAGKIVRDVLDFARRREPTRDLVALDQLVDRALALFEGRLQRARVEVARVFDGGPPLLPGDRDQLTQVFINLIGNAIDAMPEGGLLTIETGLYGGDNGHRYAGVDVADTGHGIPAERLPHVFESFYTTKPEGSGTGLGLPISRRIVDAHGGTLEADSAPGRGTRMRVRLPMPERG
ncbi:MAG TPA: ATP-binding protein [Methylomirabilota bacterium]